MMVAQCAKPTSFAVGRCVATLCFAYCGGGCTFYHCHKSTNFITYIGNEVRAFYVDAGIALFVETYYIANVRVLTDTLDNVKIYVNTRKYTHIRNEGLP